MARELGIQITISPEQMAKFERANQGLNLLAKMYVRDRARWCEAIQDRLTLVCIQDARNRELQRIELVAQLDPVLPLAERAFTMHMMKDNPFR
jgi:hypothetical protein